jgi:hypothetical protein
MVCSPISQCHDRTIPAVSQIRPIRLRYDRCMIKDNSPWEHSAGFPKILTPIQVIIVHNFGSFTRIHHHLPLILQPSLGPVICRRISNINCAVDVLVSQWCIQNNNQLRGMVFIIRDDSILRMRYRHDLLVPHHRSP